MSSSLSHLSSSRLPDSLGTLKQLDLTQQREALARLLKEGPSGRAVVEAAAKDTWEAVHSILQAGLQENADKYEERPTALAQIASTLLNASSND